MGYRLPSLVASLVKHNCLLLSIGSEVMRYTPQTQPPGIDFLGGLLYFQGCMGMVYGSLKKCMGVGLNVDLVGYYEDYDRKIGRKGGNDVCRK